MKKDFYCANEAGANFSIEEWNQKFELCNQLGIEGQQRSEILDDQKCEKQCVDCACDVGSTRIQTQKLVDQLKNQKIDGI